MGIADGIVALLAVVMAGICVLGLVDHYPRWRRWIGLGGFLVAMVGYAAARLGRKATRGADRPVRVPVPPPSIEPAARELREQAMEAAREADASQTRARDLTAEEIARRVSERAKHLVVLLLLLPGLAHAQPPAAVPMPYQGQPGVWYRLDMAQEVEGCIDARDANARRIHLLEEELRLRTDDAAGRQAREDALVRALDVSQEVANDAERDLGRARRRGRILFVVGFIAGLMLPTGVALAYR